MKQVETVAPEQASFVYMDALRFVAAVFVVLNHVRSLVLVDYGQAAGAGVLTKLLYYVAGFGHQSVMVFFVLSGFWITKSVVRRDGDPHFWTDHLIDRVSRLGIVLVPVLIVGGTLDVIGSRFVAPGFYQAMYVLHDMPDVRATLSWQSLAATLLFLQSLVAPPFGSNGPLWSLAFEFWYYIWFPALWLLRRKRLSVGLVALALGWFFPGLAMGFLSWLCGTALYFTCEAARQRGWVGRRTIAWPVLLIGGGGLLATLAYSRIYPSGLFNDPAISIAFAVALFGLYLLVPPQPRFLLPIARYGAQSSFSLYSLHFPVAALLAASLVPTNRLQPGAGSIALIFAVTAAAVVAGYLFSRVTEHKTGALRKRLRGLVQRDSSRDKSSLTR